jgi:cytidine deaminase
MTNSVDMASLAADAWKARENAYILGPTPVGCAVLSRGGVRALGCNVEHRFRSHDVHAEVNAISNLVAMGHQDLLAVVIAAERERFTPCGACLDWIFEFGGHECLVAWQATPSGAILERTAHDLMPYYPR